MGISKKEAFRGVDATSSGANATKPGGGFLRLAEQAVDFVAEELEVERLLEEGIAAELFGLVDHDLIHVAGVDNHFDFGISRFRKPQNIEAGHVGKFHVHQREVGAETLERLDAVFARVGALDLEALFFEKRFHFLHNPGLVIDDQKFFHLQLDASMRKFGFSPGDSS